MGKLIKIDGKAGLKARQQQQSSKLAAVKRRWKLAVELRESLKTAAV